MYCLSSFYIKDLNLRNHKKSDWLAYKHSQSKTIRDFERRYIFISIDAANEYNLIFNAEAFPGYSDELSIKTFFSLNQKKDEIGKKIQMIYHQCKQIQIRDKKEIA